jgi:hypothetical protein
MCVAAFARAAIARKQILADGHGYCGAEPGRRNRGDEIGRDCKSRMHRLREPILAKAEGIVRWNASDIVDVEDGSHDPPAEFSPVSSVFTLDRLLRQIKDS